MITALRRFRALSRLERRMFVRGVILLPAAACALRFFPLRDVLCLMGPRSMRRRLATEGKHEETRGLVEAAQRMTEAASRYGVVRGNCLSKSIVLWRLLRRAGVPASVRLGGCKEDRQFAAHAWVELDGRVINDPDTTRRFFVPLQRAGNGALTGER